MTKFGIFASVFMAAFAPIAVGCAHLQAQNDTPRVVPIEAGEPIDGMFFSTEFVSEHYECDIDMPGSGIMSIGCVRYDCPDANLYGAEVLLTWDSYVEVHNSLTQGAEECGHLQELYTLGDGTPVFTLNYDME